MTADELEELWTLSGGDPGAWTHALIDHARASHPTAHIVITVGSKSSLPSDGSSDIGGTRTPCGSRLQRWGDTLLLAVAIPVSLAVFTLCGFIIADAVRTLLADAVTAPQIVVNFEDGFRTSYPADTHAITREPGWTVLWLKGEKTGPHSFTLDRVVKAWSNVRSVEWPAL